MFWLQDRFTVMPQIAHWRAQKLAVSAGEAG
jgi:hypothetical protein